MTTYAQFNEAGAPIAFYDDSIVLEIPEGCIEISPEQHKAIVAEPEAFRIDGGRVVPAPVPRAKVEAALRAEITGAIQHHLDTTARERNYDSIQSAITYREDPNPQFAAEADALFAWRSAVWTYATEQLAAVEAGKREAPETAESFIAVLPAFEWPPR